MDEIQTNHPYLVPSGLVLCDGSWPGAHSADIHWLAFGAIATGARGALDQEIAATVAKVMAYRASVPVERRFWRQDTPDAVPAHWHTHPAVAALLEAWTDAG